MPLSHLTFAYVNVTLCEEESTVAADKRESERDRKFVQSSTKSTHRSFEDRNTYNSL